MGCGGATSTGPSETATAPSPAATTAPPTATPAGSPTPDLGAIGDAYLAAATAVNDAIEQANAAIDVATTDEEATAAYLMHVDAFDQAAAAVSAIEFPPALGPDVTKLLDAYRKAGNAFARLAVDPNDDDPFIGSDIDEAQATILAAATKIRAALGLPPPPAPQPS